MQPEIHLGPLTLQSFGLMMGLGFVVAGLLTAKRLKEIGRPPDWAYEMVFAALIGGIVLYAIGFEWLGIVIALASIPCALAAWVTSADRRL